jgi:glycosyltransferase involved in cell wall biosynthesis
MTALVSPLVSVVVPVYGTAAFLPLCLDSLLGQTLADLEIIIVNDASPDASQEIIERYVASDSRLKPLINPENLNLYETRRRGFAAATGAYITTCDSDDYMPPEALERLYQTARITGADLVHGRTAEFTDKRQLGLNYSSLPFRAATGPDFVKAMLRHGRGLNVWGKLYRRRIVESALADLPAGKRLFLSEDLLYSYFIGLKAGRYAALPEVVYQYRYHRGSYFRNQERWRLNVIDLFEVLAILKKHITSGGAAAQDFSLLLDSLIKRFFCSIFYYQADEIYSLALQGIWENRPVMAGLDSRLLPGQAFLGSAGLAWKRFGHDWRMARDGYEYYIVLRRYLSVLKKYLRRHLK